MHCDLFHAASEPLQLVADSFSVSPCEGSAQPPVFWINKRCACVSAAKQTVIPAADVMHPADVRLGHFLIGANCTIITGSVALLWQRFKSAFMTLYTRPKARLLDGSHCVLCPQLIRSKGKFSRASDKVLYINKGNTKLHCSNLHFKTLPWSGSKKQLWTTAETQLHVWDVLKGFMFSGSLPSPLCSPNSMYCRRVNDSSPAGQPVKRGA